MMFTMPNHPKGSFGAAAAIPLQPPAEPIFPTALHPSVPRRAFGRRKIISKPATATLTKTSGNAADPAASLLPRFQTRGTPKPHDLRAARPGHVRHTTALPAQSARPARCATKPGMRPAPPPRSAERRQHAARSACTGCIRVRLSVALGADGTPNQANRAGTAHPATCANRRAFGANAT